MATELYGTGGFTEEARTYYVMELLERAKPFLRHAGWGIKKNIPRRGGYLANFRRLEQVPGQVSWIGNEGTPPAVQNVTWVAVTVTPKTWGAFDLISDRAWHQGIDELVGEYTDMWGGMRGRTIDLVARDIIVAGTNVQYAAGSAATGISTGAVMTAAFLLKGIASLKKRGALPHPAADGLFPCLTHPDVYADMVVDDDIAAALQHALPRAGSNPLFTGGGFDFGGARIIEAAFARVKPSAGLSVNIAVYVTQLLGEGYYGEVGLEVDSADIKVKTLGSAGADDPLDQYASIGWRTDYMCVVLNQNFGERLESAAVKNDNSAAIYPTY